MDKLAQYRKLIAYLVGLVVVVLAAFFEIGDGETFFGISQDVIVNGVIALMTGLGIWGLSNETPTE